MASYRIGIGSFNLKDGAVGIGTESTGLGNLKVEGTLKTTDLDVGVSTFTRYAGFEGEEARFDKDVSLSGEYSTTGDIAVESGATLTVGLGSTACIGSVECISVKHHFSVPVGGTSERNKSSGYTEGTVRYNRDLGTMEFFNGNEWRQFTYIADIQNSPSSRGRAIIAGGYDIISPATVLSNIESLQLSTFGNSISFGDITSGATNALSAMSSSTRMLMVKGDGITIEYLTIASEGNPIDFGDTHTQMYRTGGEGASSTRGVILGGRGAPGNGIVNIQYVEMGTLGNMLDFGDLNTNGRGQSSGGASPIRAFATSFTSYGSKVEMITMASTGNATNFGNLTFNGGYNGGCSNNTTLIAGGGYSGADTNSIRADICKYDMTSGGQAVTFGEFPTQKGYAGSTSNPIRGVYCGGFIGNPGSGNTNVTTIDAVEFSSGGGTTFFGDLGVRGYDQACSSDSHGGLGGF